VRPLDRLHSIKLKLVIVIVSAVAISVLVNDIGWRLGIPISLRPLIAVALSLLLVYPFSRGITSPLRRMATAATAMSQGDFSHPVTVTSRDEVGELARAFEQMRSQLAAVDRQRRGLVANVSHELRTPLTVLRVRLENMVDGVEPADADALAATLAEIERLSELVERVLDLSRLESGASPLHVESFDVAQLLADATAGIDAACVEVHHEGTATFRGDRARLQQVVRNLLDNAVRHGGRGCTLHAAGGDGRLRIEVGDHGPGIPESERERVLERFYRVDGARSGDGGTGLGLAIVTEIVELHDGTIEITGNSPTGCRVLVEVPEHQEPT
jgi:signal transduction histidine kinase